ncbi:MAG: hypothetical protein LBP86_03755 [Azoarcus sp.]|jgi:hypothetical protein|nr:hypothetical protein [Azoarcus sp.]
MNADEQFTLRTFEVPANTLGRAVPAHKNVRYDTMKEAVNAFINTPNSKIPRLLQGGKTVIEGDPESGMAPMFQGKDKEKLEAVYNKILMEPANRQLGEKLDEFGQNLWQCAAAGNTLSDEYRQAAIHLANRGMNENLAERRAETQMAAMSIARALSVLDKKAANPFEHEQLRRAYDNERAFTAYQNAKNPNIEAERADAFIKSPAAAVKQYPELAGAVAAVVAVDKQAKADGLNPEQHAVVLARARQNIANSIERGEIPVMKLRDEMKREQELAR